MFGMVRKGGGELERCRIVALLIRSASAAPGDASLRDAHGEQIGAWSNPSVLATWCTPSGKPTARLKLMPTWNNAFVDVGEIAD